MPELDGDRSGRRLGRGLDLASDLGVRMVKIFAAWPGIINDEENIAMYAQYDRGSYFKPQYPSDLRLWHRAINGIREVAAMAADMGITLVLQNHAPVLRPGYEDVLAMTQEIDRENVKICLDVPLFYERQQDDYVRESVMKCKDYLVYSHFGAWNFTEAKNGDAIQDPAPGVGAPINYEMFTDALQQIGYQGYLVSEYCLPVIKNHHVAGIEDVDLATILSLRYMKQLVHHATSVHA